MTEDRITLKMSVEDVLIAMSGGNPGALTVCMDLMKSTPQVDPGNMLGGLGAIMSLDTLRIYEERIWMLYKDVCGEDIGKVIALLRAWQLGIAPVSKESLAHAIDNYGAGIVVDLVVAAVKARLPEFSPQVA